MDTDLYFVVGFLMTGFAFPLFVGAYAEGRRPRSAILLVLAGAGMIWLATAQKPNTYSMDSIPDAFARVIGTYIY